MKKAMVSQGAASLLILLWTYTAGSKLLDQDLFVHQLERSPYLGSVAKAVSIAAPVMELIIAVALLKRSWRLFGFLSSLIMLAAFSIYILLMMLTADKLPCSCGGIIAELSWGAHLAVNGGFMFVSYIGIITSSPEKNKAIAKAV